MTWYMKGQSNYDNSTGFHMGLYLDMNGYASGLYDSRSMAYHAEGQDPFMAFGIKTKTWQLAQKQVEWGLWDHNRVRIDVSGIWGWHETSGVWFSLYGGGGGGYTDAQAVAAVEAAGLVLESGKVISSADEDLTFTFGRNLLSSPSSDYAYYSHRDHGTTTNYMIRQNSAGETRVNAATSQQLSLCIAGGIQASITSAGLQVGSDARITEFDTGTLDTSDTKVPTNNTVYEAIAAVSGGISDIVEDTTPQLGGDLDLNGHGILMDATPASDGDYEGTVLEIDTTGCSTYDAVYVDGANSVLPADADAIATGKVIGIVVATGKVLTHGVVRNDAWTLTVGSAYFLSTSPGAITTTQPSGTDDVIIVVGIALGTDQLFVCPGYIWGISG